MFGTIICLTFINVMDVVTYLMSLHYNFELVFTMYTVFLVICLHYCNCWPIKFVFLIIIILINNLINVLFIFLHLLCVVLASVFCFYFVLNSCFVLHLCC